MANLGPILLSTIIDPAAVLQTTSATVASDKTYSPEGFRQGSVASWVDRSGGIALGYPRYTQHIRPPTRDSRVYKVSAKLFTPVLETIDPAVGLFGPKLAYEIQYHFDALIHERATAAEKLAHFNLFKGLMFATIMANDASPSSTTASPLIAALTTQEDVY